MDKPLRWPRVLVTEPRPEERAAWALGWEPGEGDRVWALEHDFGARWRAAVIVEACGERAQQASKVGQPREKQYNYKVSFAYAMDRCSWRSLEGLLPLFIKPGETFELFAGSSTAPVWKWKHRSSW